MSSHMADSSHRTSHLLGYNKPSSLFMYVRLCVRYYGLYLTFLSVLQVSVFFRFSFLHLQCSLELF